MSASGRIRAKRAGGGSQSGSRKPVAAERVALPCGCFSVRRGLPIGGGIGKRFTVGSRVFALSGHAYFNVIKPEGAPEGLFRIDFVLPIPVSLRQ